MAVILYFVGSESLWNATPGKFLLGLRVRAIDGSDPALLQIIARNVLRTIDGLPVLYWLGLVVIAVTPRRQRLGDLVARTIVVAQAPSVSRRYSEIWIAFLALFVLLLGGIALWFVSQVLLLGSWSFGMTMLVGSLSLLSIGLALAARRAEVRHASLAVIICASAILTCTSSWTLRYATASDHTDEIKDRITRNLPLGSSLGDVEEYLRSTDQFTRGIEVAGTEEYGRGLTSTEVAPGEAYLHTGYPAAAWGFWCPWDMEVFFIFDEGRLTDVRYALFGSGCP